MKKYGLVIFLMFYLFKLSWGQTTFNKIFDFNFPSTIFTSVLPTDSCYYVTGVFVDTLLPVRIGNIFVKFDLSGEPVFHKTLSAQSKFYETWFGDLLPTPDGNLIDIGFTTDTVRKALIIKYSPEGDTLLTREYFSINYPEFTFIVPTEIRKKETGGYVMLNTHDSGSNPDISIMVLDSNLNLTQHTAYGGIFSELPFSLILDENGGFIVGSGRDNTNKTSNNFFSQTYTIKTDSLGVIQWTWHSPMEQLQDIARAMVQTEDGGLVIASGTGIEVPTNSSSSSLRWDGLIFKLDAERNVEWSTELRGLRPTMITQLNKLIAMEDGSGYVAFGRIAEDVTDGTPRASAWMVKISTEGDSLWSRYYNFIDSIDSDPTPYDFKRTADGGFIAVGETDTDIPGAPSQVGWILKTDEFGCLVPGCNIVVAVTEAESEVRLSLYPNPATDFLNVYFRSPNLKGEAGFRIIDAAGRLMREFKSRLPDVTLIVPVSDYAPGVYFLQYLEKGLLRKTEKFLVVR